MAGTGYGKLLTAGYTGTHLLPLAHHWQGLSGQRLISSRNAAGFTEP